MIVELISPTLQLAAVLWTGLAALVVIEGWI